MHLDDLRCDIHIDDAAVCGLEVLVVDLQHVEREAQARPVACAWSKPRARAAWP
jgi:hypothetical protein